MRRAQIGATSGKGLWVGVVRLDLNPTRPAVHACARAAEDVMMRTKTTTALALAGTLLAGPAAALAAGQADDPPSPDRAALHAPVAGHLTVAAQMRAERYANLQADLTTRAARLARRLDRSPQADRTRLRGQAPGELRARIRSLQRELRAPTASRALEAIAACESGGNPAADTGNGFYGKYQFDLGTWQAVGGTGNPAHASEREQDQRAAALYARAGASPWPICER
jgi:transglycosylase-like protein